MGYSSPDVYNQPEAFGLKIVGTLDELIGWDFHMLVVFQSDCQKLYWAVDSGCSCPSPFENFNSIDELDEVTETSWSKFITAVNEMDVPEVEKVELLAKVSGQLNR